MPSLMQQFEQSLTTCVKPKTASAGAVHNHAFDAAQFVPDVQAQFHSKKASSSFLDREQDAVADRQASIFTGKGKAKTSFHEKPADDG